MKALRLYHFSEEPDISRFDPRPPLALPDAEPLVWAVAEKHAWTYLFPRDCPRVLLWALARTTPGDSERWLGGPDGKVACVEWRWLERLQKAQVFRYHLPPEPFAPPEGEDNEWMLVSREPVEPLAVERVDDLLRALSAAGVELRLMPSLAPLQRALASTVHFSGIRLRNAIGWPAD